MRGLVLAALSIAGNSYPLRSFSYRKTISATVMSSSSSSSTLQDFTAFLRRDNLDQYTNVGAGELVYLVAADGAAGEEARKACKYDLFVPADPTQWTHTKQQLLSLVEKDRRVSCTEADTLLDAGDWSHFVSLTYASMDEALAQLPQLRLGADAWELRVDLLRDQSHESVLRQIGLLRTASDLPIVFTVRSEGQIGRFPSDPEAMFSLLKQGVRAGAEWIDVEACWPSSYIDDLTTLIKTSYSKTSRILGSLHVTVPQTEIQVSDMFKACSLSGAADIVKVVTGAVSDADCLLVHACGERASKPYIGLCLGAKGSLSRVLNRRFTPVTHPLMATAAPGQLSVAELMEKRLSMGLIASKKFYLFGTPIKQSMSPAMHNSAYKAMLLPYTYSLLESDDVQVYGTVLQDKDFGGASVTIPHKETIGAFLDELSAEAQAIGAVNTVARTEGKLVGYNTDWLGIRNPIDRLLGVTSKRRGLVVGAGGTARAACFALKSLGLDVLIYNRSPEKGRELARVFNGTLVEDLSLVAGEHVAVVVSTVPSSAAFTLPTNILAHKPVVLDVVYKPVRTPLLEQVLPTSINCRLK